MKDSILYYIHDNRPKFDAAKQDPNSWASLARSLTRYSEADGLERFLLLNRPFMDTVETPANLWNALEPQLPDNLEQFLLKQREMLDTASPSGELWNQIAAELPAATTKAPGRIVQFRGFQQLARIAAAITVLLCALGLGYWYGAQQGAATTAGMAMSDVSPEYAELEDFYQRGIEQRKNELAVLAGNRDVDVLNDLKLMDASMLELKKELADVPPGNREQVVRAMIENYKAKLAILQRVLEHLQPSPSDSKNSGKNEVKSI